MNTRAILPALLDRAAERDGGHTAIVMDDRQLTYAELAAASNRIANSLRRRGVEKGDRVLVWMERAPEAVAAIWGILKAGAAYVPIDPATPQPRLAAIANNCRIAGLMTGSDRAAQLDIAAAPSSMRAIWTLDAASVATLDDRHLVTWAEIEAESIEAPPVLIGDQDLASIQYTSGSTGAPKGVMIPHRALYSQADWTAKRYDFTPEDRTGAFMPVHSPMASFDIMATVVAGATSVMIAPRNAAFPAAIAKTFSEQKTTMWYMVTTLLLMMANRGNLRALDLSTLRLVAFGGERLPLAQLREAMEALPRWVKLIHVYSRTEVKIRSYHEVKYPPTDFDTRQIGEVSPEYKMVVLDDDQRPVAPGAAGELWIAGSGLALGYWGMPDLTTATFQSIEMGPNERLRAARTGDLVRRHDDGRLELVGRTDQQIKVRGYRVEIGEVEAVLQSHPDVQRAVVVAEADADIGQRLRAIVVAKKGAGIDDRALREHCIAMLPRYMVPDVVDFRAELPISSNGKVDRLALSTTSEAGEGSRKS
jgi:amino acid adenylation domain-containing protein